MSEAKLLIPRDDLSVLGDHTHADHRSTSRSRLAESVSNQFDSETAAALLGEHTEPFQVRDGGRSELQRDAPGHQSV